MSESEPAAGGVHDVQNGSDGSLTVKLAKPIMVMDESRATLTFRKPTGGDILRCGGTPVDFDPIDSKINPVTPRMFAMMARLADVPSSSLDRMDTNDVVACAWVLAPFFLPMKPEGKVS